MKKQEIIVGARGSLLSITQAQGLIHALKRRLPRYTFLLKKITTYGDKAKDWQRLEVGIFVKELEDELLRKEIDIAVHSVKDLPSCLPKGLSLAAISRRQDPRDCLITRQKTAFQKLKRNACVGTSSLRRAAQCLALRPDIQIKDLRGNVDTRIKKLLSGEYDAIIIALAGLMRLGYKAPLAYVGKEPFFIHPLPIRLMTPACGQGALGVEIRSDNQKMRFVAKAINDDKSFLCVQCERIFLKEFGAGCRIPLGALAKMKGRQITLSIMVARKDGKKIIRFSRHAGMHNAEALAKQAAREVFKGADKDILEGIGKL